MSDEEGSQLFQPSDSDSDLILCQGISPYCSYLTSITHSLEIDALVKGQVQH